MSCILDSIVKSLVILDVALLFMVIHSIFFGDFRCGALLFMVIHVIYKYKNR